MQQYEIQLWTEKFNWKNDMVLLFSFSSDTQYNHRLRNFTCLAWKENKVTSH